MFYQFSPCFTNPVQSTSYHMPFTTRFNTARVRILIGWKPVSLPIRRRTVNGANEDNELKPCLKEKTPSYENLSASSAHSLTVFWRRSYALRWVKGEMFAGKWITGRVQKFVPWKGKYAQQIKILIAPTRTRMWPLWRLSTPLLMVSPQRKTNQSMVKCISGLTQSDNK